MRARDPLAGEVFRAVDKQSGAEVAVKVMKLGKDTDKLMANEIAIMKSSEVSVLLLTSSVRRRDSPRPLCSIPTLLRTLTRICWRASCGW